MGFTHYYNFDKVSLNDYKEGFKKAHDNLRDILNRHKRIICYEFDGNSPALLTNDSIRFNGRGDDGYETFLVRYGFGFSFCKTARMPYDLPVCECLLVLKHYIPNMELSSDGDEEDWDEAIKNVKKHYDIDPDTSFL